MAHNALAFGDHRYEEAPISNCQVCLCLLGTVAAVIGLPLLMWYWGVPRYEPGMPLHPGP